MLTSYVRLLLSKYLNIKAKDSKASVTSSRCPIAELSLLKPVYRSLNLRRHTSIMAKSDSSAIYSGYPHYAFVQNFEKVDQKILLRWFESHWHYSLYIAVAYLLLIYALKEFMKNRQPMKIRKAVLIWDASLAVFSTCGALRFIPEMIYILTNFGMEWSVCNNVANSVSMFWAWAFVFSKAPELLDTVFIVLKKRKLTFLHLSHHVLTLIITWYFSTELPAAGRWMITLNYAVHSFMYSYFALKAAKLNIPIKVSMIVTAAQILQLIAAILAGSYALRANLLGRECTTKTYQAVVGLAFGLFLLYLFVDFFLRRYNFVGVDRKTKKN